MEAKQTLSAIDQAIEKDQGASFRMALARHIMNQPDAYSGDTFPFRKHLGASLIGDPCPRKLWYTFRWVKALSHSSRILRLFNRGHLEEARFIAMLESAGFQVWQTTEQGHQFRISGVDGHYGGSLDGVVLGIPEMPTVPVLAEYKTHGIKSFSKLKKEKVKKSKYQHWVQMQTYMAKMGLTHALYLAVCKDTDELYAELVEAEPEANARYEERAETIIHSYEPPARLKDDPTWFECKYCDYSDICHNGAEALKHCRTCSSAKPVSGGAWYCERYNIQLTKEQQAIGCTDYTPLNGI